MSVFIVKRAKCDCVFSERYVGSFCIQRGRFVRIVKRSDILSVQWGGQMCLCVKRI